MYRASVENKEPEILSSFFPALERGDLQLQLWLAHWLNYNGIYFTMQIKRRVRWYNICLPSPIGTIILGGDFFVKEL